MPDHGKCTCVPQQIRAIQRTCFTAQTELQTIEDRLEAARRSVVMPLHAGKFLEGEKPPTVETEVYTGRSVLLDDHLPEMAAVGLPASPSRIFRPIFKSRSRSSDSNGELPGGRPALPLTTRVLPSGARRDPSRPAGRAVVTGQVYRAGRQVQGIAWQKGRAS